MNNPVLYILLLVTISLNAQQNLVYNGDFELYDTCPTGESTPGNYQLEHCLGWHTPTYATPDYLNPCNSTAGGVNSSLGTNGTWNAPLLFQTFGVTRTKLNGTFGIAGAPQYGIDLKELVSWLNFLNSTKLNLICLWINQPFTLLMRLSIGN